MPITDLQREVLRCVAKNRSPESYLAGATVLHRASNSPRFSQDIDLFHDLAEQVSLCAEKDAEALTAAGYKVEWLLHTGIFHRAIVTIRGEQVKMEWAQDSAFRFFPIQEDPFCGYRLHDADAATNKLLALAGRSEIRDFVDILHLHQTYLTLGTLAWAACGKDPGFTPEFLLDQASRHTAYQQSDLDQLQLQAPLDLKQLKQSWLQALDEAQKYVMSLPSKELGCFYLDQGKTPVNADASDPAFPALIRHYGAIRGAWPVVR